MTIVWGAVAVLFIVDAALFWVLRYSNQSLARLVDRPQTEPTPPYDDQPVRAEIADLRKAIASDLEEMADRMKAQTLAIAEGIERVDRSERRVDATVQRAQKKFAAAGHEDIAVEAEAEGLRLLHGDGIGTGEVQAVQPRVDNPGDQPSSVPGITVAQLQKVRGL